jgi:hypothetical protein
MDELATTELERAVGALGQSLLEFIVGTSIEQVLDTPAGEGLVKEISGVLSTVVEGSNDPAAMTQYLRYRMAEIVDGEVLAYGLHKQICGDVELPSAGDPLSEMVGQLAAQAYPVLLLPKEQQMEGFPELSSVHLSSVLFRHPLAQQFQAGVLEDTDLAAVFKHTSEHSGRTTDIIFRSTGHGSTLQLWTLLSIVIEGAWRDRNRSTPTQSVVEFSRGAVQRWQLVRSALAKQGGIKVAARMAFTGVRLPGTGPYSFGDLIVRPVDEQDRQYMPPGLAGQLTGTDAEGNTVVVDYAGDVVAETTIPYLLRFRDPNEDRVPDFPKDVLVPRSRADELGQRLRASLLLAVTRDHRVQLVPAWQSVDDPLEHMPSMGWHDPRQAVGLMPTQLTGQEVLQWQEWFELLGTPGAERVNIALSRVLRAVGERRDPVDVLIDAVIAWENIFGSSQGESTLRVTASMARLIEDDTAERDALRGRLADIYKLRSKAVHGNGQPKDSELPLCYDALTYAIQTLRKMFRDRPDLLDHKDGTGRSLKLLLE